MPTLHVALEEGFDHDEVRILVDGVEVYRKQDVSTRLQIGLADSFDVDVGSGPAVGIDVALPARQREQHLTVAVQAPMFLGISLDGSGQVQHRLSSTPFGYV